MLAALATVVVPVAPASAAPALKGKAAVHKLLEHAERGEALILSFKQLKQIKATNKNLHDKLMSAYRANAVPVLSAEEKHQLQAVTRNNIAAMKAGSLEGVAATATVLSAGGLL